MKLLYGTSNPSKLKHMEEMLMGLDIETRKYFVDIDKSCKNEEEITKGFRQFFERTILGLSF